MEITFRDPITKFIWYPRRLQLFKVILIKKKKKKTMGIAFQISNYNAKL